MAVPPEGARVIVEAVLKTFAGIEYESEEPRWKDAVSEIVENVEKKKRKGKKKDNQEREAVLRRKEKWKKARQRAMTNRRKVLKHK